MSRHSITRSDKLVIRAAAGTSDRTFWHRGAGQRVKCRPTTSAHPCHHSSLSRGHSSLSPELGGPVRLARHGGPRRPRSRACFRGARPTTWPNLNRCLSDNARLTFTRCHCISRKQDAPLPYMVVMTDERFLISDRRLKTTIHIWRDGMIERRRPCS